MFNNRIGITVLVLITLFVFTGTDGCGQDTYGQIEVLGEWQDSGVSGIQAFGDTILRAFTGKSPFPSRDIQVSIDGGLTWKSVVTVPRLREFIPCIGSRLTEFTHVDNLVNAQEYWTIRRGKLEHHDTLGVDEKKGMVPFSILQYHPLDEGILFAIGTRDGGVTTYETLYTSTDDGRTWREYDLPEPTYGFSRKVKVRVDYSDPKYLFVAVNGDDGFGSPNIDEWYRLTLEKGELEPHLDIGIFNNYWRMNTTVFRGYRNTLPNQPALCDVFTSSCDTLRWSDIIRETLLSEYQIHSPSLYIDPIVASFREDSQFETFHPLRRGVYISTVRFTQDTSREAERYIGVVITIDTGRTWMWLAQPEQKLSYINFALDPVTMNVYMTRTRYVSKGTEYYAMLKIVPTVLHVDEVEPGTHGQVFPIPASEMVTIDERYTENATVRVIDVHGRSVDCTYFSSSNGAIVVNIRHIASGVYYVDVVSQTRRRFIPIVVQH